VNGLGLLLNGPLTSAIGAWAVLLNGSEHIQAELPGFYTVSEHESPLTGFVHRARRCAQINLGLLGILSGIRGARHGSLIEPHKST